MLYLFSEADGLVTLAAAAPDGFKPAGHFSVSGEGSSRALPVVNRGRLYLRYDMNLYCFELQSK